MQRNRDSVPCCCGDLVQRPFERRRLFLLAAAGGLAAAAPSAASAAPYELYRGRYEAMALACIDPRFQAPVFNYLGRRGLTGKYSQFTIAGAAAGVVAPAFEDWYKAFWNNLAASIELHQIKRVIVVNHRDCGAIRLAYGDASIATAEAENKTHRMILGEFRKQLARRHPGFAVEAGLMALDGTIKML